MWTVGRPGFAVHDIGDAVGRDREGWNREGSPHAVERRDDAIACLEATVATYLPLAPVKGGDRLVGQLLAVGPLPNDARRRSRRGRAARAVAIEAQVEQNRATSEHTARQERPEQRHRHRARTQDVEPCRLTLTDGRTPADDRLLRHWTPRPGIAPAGPLPNRLRESRYVEASTARQQRAGSSGGDDRIRTGE